MKTSLNIDDVIFKAAQKASQQSGKTISETISDWARVGRESLTRQKKLRRRAVPPVNLGGVSRIDLTCRRDWMDLLES